MSEKENRTKDVYFIAASNSSVQKKSLIENKNTVQNKKPLPGTSNRKGTSLICPLQFYSYNTPSLLLETSTSVPKFDKDLSTDRDISQPLKDKKETHTKKELPDKSKNLSQANNQKGTPVLCVSFFRLTYVSFSIQWPCSEKG